MKFEFPPPINLTLAEKPSKFDGLLQSMENVMPPEAVIQFGLTPESARRTLNELAKDSKNVFFSEHAEKRMKQRKISRTQVLRCLRTGTIVEGPSKSIKGNWEVKMEVFTAGEAITTVAAIEYDKATGSYFVVITVF